MADKYVNKVIYDGNTLIDLTSDTVTKDKVLSGYTLHDATGKAETGTCTYDADTTDATAAVAEVLDGKTYYAQGTKKTGTMPNRGTQTSTISTVAQEVTIQNGYHDGSGKVSIASGEQAKIVAGNILQGVTILGVTGTVEPSSEIEIQPTKTVVPTSSAQTILPDKQSTAPTFSAASTYRVGDCVVYNSAFYRCKVAVVTPGAWTGSTNWDEVDDYDVMSQIVVAAVPYTETENGAGGKTVTIL